MPKLSPQPRPAAYIEDDAAELIPPPPAAPPPARAVVVVIPPGPYSPQEYADTAAEIARACANWPTPAPQLARALAQAVADWRAAQQ